MAFNEFVNFKSMAPLNEGQKHFGVFPKDRIVFNGAVSDWCLHNAARCLSRQDMEESLQWNALAARVLSFECAVLTSTELENQLIQIGAWLRTPEIKAEFCAAQPKRWLHVLTTAYSSGGHTAMLRRWIQLDPKHNNHSVVLLEQDEPVPESLAEAVHLTGGEVIRMDLNDPMLSRAGHLREIVWTQADVVVLHIHPWDVISTVALALPGGPPVLLVNHAAHIFWVGTSVTDMILNCRHSLQEDEWTKECRCISEIMHLPIPLPEPDYIFRRDSEFREKARKILQLPEDAVVMLTVGLRDKYNPLPGINFFHAVGTVLKAHKKAYLIAVGQAPDVHWIGLEKEIEGRLLMVGKKQHSEMSVYFAASDLYLEGFPFGSTTALLEAGLMGIPCVLSPKECPPPFTTDGIALQDLEQPTTISDYVERILSLLDDKPERLRLGELMSRSIKTHHCGENWTEYLSIIQKNLPAVHSIRIVHNPKRVQDYLSTYWSAFSSIVNGNPFAFVCKQRFFPSLKIRIDGDLLELILRGKTGYETDKLANILMEIGDHYYWQNDFDQARQYYEYALKHNPLGLRILIKFIMLLMGSLGVRFRNGASKVKMKFQRRLHYKSTKCVP